MRPTRAAGPPDVRWTRPNLRMSRKTSRSSGASGAPGVSESRALQTEHEAVVRGDGTPGDPFEQHLTGHAQVDRQEEIAAERKHEELAPPAHVEDASPGEGSRELVGCGIQQHGLDRPVDGTDAAAREGRRQLTADRLYFG